MTDSAAQPSDQGSSPDSTEMTSGSTIQPTRSMNMRMATAMCALVLCFGGLGHRWLSNELARAAADPVMPLRSLASLPMQIGSWTGVAVALDNRVLEMAGCDDYVYRHYVDEASQHVVELYLSYSARPANMLRHRPGVCYPAHGWTLAAATADQVPLSDGAELACNVYRFVRGPSMTEAVLVRNYYVLAGRHTTEWTDFSGLRWRLPNLSRSPEYYVVQVLATTNVLTPHKRPWAETQLRRFVADLAPAVSRLLEPTRP